MKHYYDSAILTLIAIIIGFAIGGPAGAGIVLLLGVLETSLSFDNAVVNASVLQGWDAKWRRRFITYGMPIAVFGMRLVFPLLIVSIAVDISPLTAFGLAIDSPDQYESILTSVHHEISAFGGAFLMMVFLKFFIDETKDVHWLSIIEKPLAAAGKLEAIEIVITLGVVLLTAQLLPAEEHLSFIVAGVSGLITFVITKAVGSLVGGEAGESAGTKVIQAGVGGFLYLELLDASFSFDGVIAAFALTNNILVIMTGLAVGAMFVRSMTIHLVEAGTLTELRYLEHSAFWAIGSLATIMFAGTLVEIPELVTGLVGAGAITAGVWSSYRANKTEPAVPSTQTS